MDKLTRRGLLAATQALGFGSLLGTPATLAADVVGTHIAAKGQLLLMGPFPLGDLYKCHRANGTERLTDCLAKGTGPSEDAIIRTFNDCRLYTIDKRAQQQSGRWEFVEHTEGYPKLAAEGKLFHALEEGAVSLLRPSMRLFWPAGRVVPSDLPL